MANTISNACNRSITDPAGTVPDVSGAMKDYFQPLTFDVVQKNIVGFQVIETTTPVTFMGLVQPYTPRELMLRPEGQRAWTWFNIWADPVFTLQVDDVVLFRGKQTRVMSRTDYALYGYVTYSLVQDWTGSGPTVVTP